MAEFTGTASIYVSKSGDNLNAGSDPNLPKLTPDSGWAGDSRVGAGLYQGVYNLAPNPGGDPLLLSDIQKQAVLDGLATGSLFSGLLPTGGGDQCTIDGFIVRGYDNIINNTGSQNGSPGFAIRDSIIIGGNIILRANIAWNVDFLRTVFIGTTFTFIGNTANFNAEWFQCMFFNCTINATGSTSVNAEISSSYIENLVIQNDGVDTIRNCCLRGSNTLIAPNQIFNITDDPLFLGDPENRFQFLVASNSPLLARGEGGVNIGNVREGLQIAENTVGWGVSPAVNDNTEFSSSFLILTNPVALTGFRESSQFDLGRQVVSPTPTLDGLSDFVNNVPDSNNALVNPNHLTLEISYAGSDLVFTAFKPFVYNRPIQLDTMGRSNGEVNFDWNNVVNQNIRYLFVRPTIRDDYNQA